MNRTTHEIVLQNLETVDLKVFEPLDAWISQVGTIDLASWAQIDDASEFSKETARIQKETEANKVNEAIEKNPTKKDNLAAYRLANKKSK